MSKIGIILFFMLLYFQSAAQLVIRKITLHETIELAKEQSLEAMEAKNTLHIAHWQYRSYRADLLPNVDLRGTLPSLNKSYNRYQNSDGTYKFVSNSSLSENMALSIKQNIPYTGGSITFQSEMERLDQIGERNSTNYLTMPAMVTLSQPIFAYNPLKWDMRTEPIRDIESQKQYIVNIEGVCIKAIGYYFELLLSLINKNIAEQNVKNATQLYKIAEGKKTLGLISENEMQQLRFTYINSSASIIEAQQDYERKMYQLRTFLGFNDTVELIPEVPNDIPEFNIIYDEVMAVVNRNNPFTEAINRRLIETDRLIAQARSERGPKLDAFVSLGYSGNATSLHGAYKNLQNRQIASLGVRVPILDWGKGKGKVVIAKYQKEVETGRIKRDVQNFEQDIKILVDKIQNQNRLLEMYKLADSIAQNRYKIAYETFVMGKINVLDINTAQLEEDNAKRNFINQIYFSWLYYYQLRQVSLYDFQAKRNIINNIEKTLWTEKYLNKLLNNEHENE